MASQGTILDCSERCRKFEEECRRSGKSASECKDQRRSCQSACIYT